MIRGLLNFLRPAPDEPPYRTPPVPYKPGTEHAQWGNNDGPPSRSWLSRLLRRP